MVSDSVRIDADDPWAATTRVVSRQQAPEAIAELKREQDGDVVMFGSTITWNPLMTLTLVDELVILVGAALLGHGTPVYRGSPRPLRLVEASVLPGPQLVAPRYDATG